MITHAKTEKAFGCSMPESLTTLLAFAEAECDDREDLASILGFEWASPAKRALSFRPSWSERSPQMPAEFVRDRVAGRARSSP